MKRNLFYIIFIIFFLNANSENISSDKLKLLTKDWQKFAMNKSEWQNYDFFNNKPLIIYGTSGDEEENSVNETIAGVVEFRFKKWLNKENKVGNIIKDIEVTEDILKNNDFVLIGSPKSNYIINFLNDFLPIKIFDNKSIKINNYEFKENESGVILKYPNPFNPKKMIWIITSHNYEYLRFIPKNDDYVVYKISDYNIQSDRYIELAEGNYDNDWKIKNIKFVDNDLIETEENKIIPVREIKKYNAPEWAKRGVMYEIFVRSFYDSNNDGIGDLKGLIQKLDYLNDGNPLTDSDLGIDVIWLMPIFDSPSYHGYDVRDYLKINPDYGTNDDFRKFLQEAHKRGIKVVIDLIFNHCSNQHKFYKDAYNNPKSKYTKYFYFTNKSNTRAHNWYFRNDPKDRNMYDPYMPAWNVNNKEVRNYLFNIAKYWIDPNKDGKFDDGVDGFRCDYAMGPPHEFWKEFRQEIKSLNPEVLLLAEVWSDMNSIKSYFYDEFDMAFDFPFQGALNQGITSASSTEIIKTLENQKIFPEDALLNRFLNNHDMERIYSRMSVEKAKLGSAILFTIPHMPMIYYGDEIGMKGRKDPYDEGLRRPMEWCADNNCKGMTRWYPVFEKNPDGISVEEQINDNNSLLNYFKSLIKLRKEHNVLETGDLKFINIYNNNQIYKKALSYIISNEKEKILVVVNLHKKVDISLDLSEINDINRLKNIFGNYEKSELIINKENSKNITLKCNDYSVYVFSIE